MSGLHLVSPRTYGTQDEIELFPTAVYPARADSVTTSFLALENYIKWQEDADKAMQGGTTHPSQKLNSSVKEPL